MWRCLAKAIKLKAGSPLGVRHYLAWHRWLVNPPGTVLERRSEAWPCAGSRDRRDSRVLTSTCALSEARRREASQRRVALLGWRVAMAEGARRRGSEW